MPSHCSRFVFAPGCYQSAASSSITPSENDKGTVRVECLAPTLQKGQEAETQCKESCDDDPFFRGHFYRPRLFHTELHSLI